ncbi:hypothetical protein [Candidatus Villigracilis affinis]|uniref:hypothetical protein n=1 Tax=Candidatus Villigracilis affinis TaxID=3140682 RepID=UPI002A22F76F|nr:hypothetical protein [Anaerolineales bacterium]
MVERCQKVVSEGKKISYSFISNIVLSGKGEPSTIEEFTELLGNNLFEYNDGMARYALARLDEENHSREYAPDLWARNEKGLFVWTVEHIFLKAGIFLQIG